MNTKKCNYAIFSASGNSGKKGLKIQLNLKLNHERIPYSRNPIFLGIIFDEYLNFSKNFESSRERALTMVNIIKIFSHRSWHLNSNTLVIGSIFYYAFFALANISEESEKLTQRQRVQNREIRCIYRLDWNCLNSDISKISNVLCRSHA